MLMVCMAKSTSLSHLTSTHNCSSSDAWESSVCGLLSVKPSFMQLFRRAVQRWQLILKFDNPKILLKF
uniref:Uncharacterized protein n=1 Tax=Anguilla anguilla TaxID=7936 RepID=A0A0E9TAU3_ANGAN